MIKLNYAGDGSILRMPDGGYEINVCGEEGSDGKQIMRTCYALTMNDAMRCFVNLNFELGNIDTLGEDEVGHMCLEFAPDGVYAIERVYPPVLTGSAMMQPHTVWRHLQIIPEGARHGRNNRLVCVRSVSIFGLALWRERTTQG